MANNNKLWLIMISMWVLIGLMSVEVVIIYITRDLYFSFIYSVLAITWIVLYVIYKKNCHKSLTKKK